MDLNNMIINSNSIITKFLDIDFKQTPFFIILSNKIILFDKIKLRVIQRYVSNQWLSGKESA